MRPVYMITGFLESGKSEFISFTIEQPYFQSKSTTLLILCEEGEIEYDPELLKKTNTVVEIIDEEADFNPDNLSSLDKKHKPDRVIIEFNGMWNYKNVKLPWYWTIEQQITLIDASTFPMYYTNMKSLLNEMVKKSEMIIFNRCDGLGEELASYRRNIKAVNTKAEIIFEDAQGEISSIFEEDLPYDVKKSVLNISNADFGIFYIDMMDNIDRYVGKQVTFLAQVNKPKGVEKGFFVPGRVAMTCCADDLAFMGLVCKYDGADSYKDQDWITITAKVGKQARAEYDGHVGPVLDALHVEPAKPLPPKEQVITFG